jgi:hypothetical protein
VLAIVIPMIAPVDRASLGSRTAYCLANTRSVMVTVGFGIIAVSSLAMVGGGVVSGVRVLMHGVCPPNGRVHGV